MPAQLRIYPGPDDLEETTEKPTAEKRDDSVGRAEVSITLGELLPLVNMAQNLRMLWLKDFMADEVRISADLHEVLQHFKSKKPTA